MEKLRLKILDIFKTTVQKLAVSLKRFPEAIVLAAAATLIMITMNHLEIMSGHLDETLRRVAMVLALGIPLALCLKIFLEGASKIKKTMKLLLYGAAALCLIFYYFYLLPPDINLIAGIRYIALTLALYFLFTFIPYLDKRPGYEQYIIALIRQFLITVLYAVVLFLGLAAMVFTIDQLLFHLSGRLYLDLWLLTVFYCDAYSSSLYWNSISVFCQNPNHQELAGRYGFPSGALVLTNQHLYHVCYLSSPPHQSVGL